MPVETGYDQRVLWRTATVSLCLGTVCYVAFGALHGSLSGAGGAQVIYNHLLERPYWSLIHIVGMFSILAWVAGFTAIAGLLQSRHGSGPAADLMGRIALVTMAIGATVALLLFAVDAYVLPGLTQAWATGSPEAQISVEQTGNLLHQLIREPLFNADILLLRGVPFALLGLAVALGGLGPRWLGWAGCTIGAVITLTAASWFVRFPVFPEVLLWALFLPLEWAWTLVFGVALWRQGDRESRLSGLDRAI